MLELAATLDRRVDALVFCHLQGGSLIHAVFLYHGPLARWFCVHVLSHITKLKIIGPAEHIVCQAFAAAANALIDLSFLHTLAMHDDHIDS